MTGPAFAPTDEQLAVCDAVAEPGRSVMVDASAGCSKSTTLELAAKRTQGTPSLALAFNRKIVADLAPRLPGNFTVKSLNSLGYGAWVRANPGVVKWDLDDKKTGRLCSQVARDRKIELLGDDWDGLRRLVGRAMLAGVVPGGGPGELAPDDPETWRELATEIWIPEPSQDLLVDLAREVLRENNELAKRGKISFDDQVYASVCLGGRFPQFPRVFLDEAQDLNALNHAMVAKALRPGGQLAAVGDPKQSIYAFRGSVTDSMRRLRGLVSGEAWLDRRLSMTFRCPRVIVERQQRHVPGFRAAPGNREGVFARLGAEPGPPEWTWAQVQRIAEQERCHSVAVICRNNAPLLGLAFQLLRQQVGVVMLGRDIGRGLVALARKIVPEPRTAADACAGAVRAWAERESGLAQANGHEERVAGIADRAECLQAVLSGAACRDAGDLVAMLERLFSRETGQVVLTTGHRAKGLEWDLVLHLDPWRIPGRRARAAGGEELEQELNVRYVIETRARAVLLEGNLEGFEVGEEE